MIKLQQVFNPIVVILISIGLLLFDHSNTDTNGRELITDPLLWVLAAYWTTALILHQNKNSKK